MQQIVDLLGTGDFYVFQYLNNRANCRMLNMIMPWVTHLGGAVFCILITLVPLVFGKGQLQLAALQAFLALSSSFFAGLFLKKSFNRLRPYLVIPGTFTGKTLFTDYSFPSGHTTAAFSVAVSYSMEYSFWIVPLVLLALLVGLSRIYLGQHYLTDVLAGMILGTVSAVITGTYLVLPFLNQI